MTWPICCKLQVVLAFSWPTCTFGQSLLCLAKFAVRQTQVLCPSLSPPHTNTQPSHAPTHSHTLPHAPTRSHTLPRSLSHPHQQFATAYDHVMGEKRAHMKHEGPRMCVSQETRKGPTVLLWAALSPGQLQMEYLCGVPHLLGSWHAGRSTCMAASA